jgi:DNA-binding transcriptional ArsR family regulator
VLYFYPDLLAKDSIRRLSRWDLTLYKVWTLVSAHVGNDDHQRQAPAVKADAVLRALTEPQRLRILRLVRDGELPAGQIAEHFDITAQAVSQHLKVLKDAGVLTERRDGTKRLYSIRPEAVESLHAFLDELWPPALARLKDAIENDGRPTEARRDA